MRKSLFIPILMSVIPTLLILLFLSDMFNVYFGNDDYPFGSTAFSPISIYHSKTVYVTYHVAEISFLIAMIYFTFKHRWRVFYILLIINIVLFLYPIFTIEG